MYIKKMYQKWSYEGKTLIIDINEDYDRDVAKATHIIIDSKGNETIAPLSPYEFDRNALELYVDCKMPSKKDNGGYNYRYDDLSKIFYSKEFRNSMQKASDAEDTNYKKRA